MDERDDPPESEPGMDEAARPEPLTDAPDFTGKTCFVIMPFGGPDRPSPGGGPGASEKAHFNAVYDLICETVESLKIKPLRSDRRAEALPIHARMLEDIIDADLAIVDLTGHNANVFYELGVRHTARRHSTILIGQKGTLPPFNLSGVRLIGYDLSTAQSVEESRNKLRDAIIANLSARVTDSLVHSLLSGLNLTRPQQRLDSTCERIEVPLLIGPSASHARARKGRDQPEEFRLGVIKGDLVDVDMVDVWVNPENTRMEMARIHDSSVSAFIRFHGALRDETGHIRRDRIYDSLRRRVSKMPVEVGAVIATAPGELRRQNAKAIFHVGAQHGEPCNGYHTIRTYPKVVSNSLETMDRLNKNPLARWRETGSLKPFESILFPLLGVRNRELDPIEVTVGLIREARKHLTLWPDTRIRRVYFLAYTRRDLELCEAAFQRLGMPLPTNGC